MCNVASYIIIIIIVTLTVTGSLTFTIMEKYMQEAIYETLKSQGLVS